MVNVDSRTTRRGPRPALGPLDGGNEIATVKLRPLGASQTTKSPLSPRSSMLGASKASRLSSSSVSSRYSSFSNTSAWNRIRTMRAAGGAFRFSSFGEIRSGFSESSVSRVPATS